MKETSKDCLIAPAEMESCRSLFGLNCLQKIPTEDQSPGNSLNDRSSTKKFSAKRLLFEEDDDDGDATETTLTSQAISGFSYRYIASSCIWWG